MKNLKLKSIFDPGLPNELSIYWHQYPYPFGEAFCKIRSFLSESASYANVLTILSFSLERYLAICRPLYVFPLSDLKRALLVSSLCWATAMLASVPHLLFTRYSQSSAALCLGQQVLHQKCPSFCG